MTDTPPDEHPRGSSWCHEVRRLTNRHPDDPRWCWCGHEIIYEIGQCPECQEDASNAE